MKTTEQANNELKKRIAEKNIAQRVKDVKNGEYDQVDIEIIYAHYMWYRQQGLTIN